VKRSSADGDLYKKVLDRPYIAPVSVLCTSIGKDDEEAQTSHCDYNFDEKDYTNRRKTSTKYHEPLRRISSHHLEALGHDKKNLKRHKKKHKKDGEREARLHELVNHEEQKAKSREKSGHRRHGVVGIAPEHADVADGGREVFALDSQDIKDTTLDTPAAEAESEKIPSLASREDDTIEEAEPLLSHEIPHVEGENELQKQKETKVDIPMKDGVKVPTSIAEQQQQQSSKETKPLLSLATREDISTLKPLQQQTNDIKETKVDISLDEGKIPSLVSRDDDTTEQVAVEKSRSPNVVKNHLQKQTEDANDDDDDDEVGLQMKQIRMDGELPSAIQFRKFAPKERADSFVDILPKIHENVESSDDPVSIIVSEYEGDRGDREAVEQDIELHHRDKDRLSPNIISEIHKRHHHHHHRKHHRKHEVQQHRTVSEREALANRSRIRSGLLTLQETQPEVDHSRRSDSIEGETEADTLEKKDLDEIAWHRFEDLRGLRRRRPHFRKPRLKSGTLTRQSSTDTLAASVLNFPVKYDHSPHEAFIELQELTHKADGLVWRETARWIKFEEDVEASNRWGRPHVASLTFQSLLELRRGLEKGTVLLDLEQFDIHSIVETIAENMVITDQLARSDKGVIIDALLLKHRHQYQEEAIPRRQSFYNLMSMSQNVPKDPDESKKFPEQPEALNNESGVIRLNIDENSGSDFSDLDDPQKSQVPLYISDSDETPTPKREVSFAPPKPAEKGTRKNESNLKSRIPADAEATAVMVGAIKDLKSPVLAFVRIAKGCYLEGLTEVDIPCRFIFVMLGPSEKEDTYYEIGRSISTLMSDQVFHDLAYYSESREDLLQAINEFLDDTIVLPPGEWDRQLLIPLLMGQSKVMAKRRKEAKQINGKCAVFHANPLSRKVSANGTTVTVGTISLTEEPNTALMSVILLFGTFSIAFYMQKVRHSHFFGKQMRRLISDLGIIIAMTIMTILDIAVGDRVVTDKVSFGNPFTLRQRISYVLLIVWIFIGISIVLAPVVHHLPVPVLFGVLLYLGVASLSHIQLVNRFVMLFMPPKHHPDVRYVRKLDNEEGDESEDDDLDMLMLR
ncbi:hypothetical protein QZH41_008530, partial [Actinostola sp. cb2023]